MQLSDYCSAFPIELLALPDSLVPSSLEERSEKTHRAVPLGLLDSFLWHLSQMVGIVCSALVGSGSAH